MTENIEATTTNETITETTDARIFATLQEAKQHQPSDKPKWTLYGVTDPSGKTSYAWAGGPDSALTRVARSNGWKVSKSNGATKDKAAQMLAQLSAEDRAALIAQYAPAPAAPEKPAGRRGSK